MPLGGFRDAPITKAIFFSLIGTYVLNSYVSGGSPTRGAATWSMTVRGIFERGEYWRILTCHFKFNSMGEMVVGLPILYMFRQFERQLGSRKFGLHVLVSIFLATTLQLSLLFLIPTLQYITPGPYALIFAFFPKYFAFVPKMHPKFLNLFGLFFSDKSICYLLGAQLAANDGAHSLWSAISGIAAGALLVGEPSILQNRSMPKLISDLCEKWLLPLLMSNPPNERSARRRREARPVPGGAYRPLDVPSGRRGPIDASSQRDHPTTNATNTASTEAVSSLSGAAQPREDDINRLLSLARDMGMGRREVVEALRVSENNVQRAANFLLAGSNGR